MTLFLRLGKVHDVMTKGVHRVYADDDLKIAEKVMKVVYCGHNRLFLLTIPQEHQIRRVCVFDRSSNKLSGILSMHDFATEVDPAEAGKVIKKVSM
jgi:CBS domain-containing protein